MKYFGEKINRKKFQNSWNISAKKTRIKFQKFGFSFICFISPHSSWLLPARLSIHYVQRKGETWMSRERSVRAVFSVAVVHRVVFRLLMRRMRAMKWVDTRISLTILCHFQIRRPSFLGNNHLSIWNLMIIRKSIVQDFYVGAIKYMHDDRFETHFSLKKIYFLQHQFLAPYT